MTNVKKNSIVKETYNFYKTVSLNISSVFISTYIPTDYKNDTFVVYMSM